MNPTEPPVLAPRPSDPELPVDDLRRQWLARATRLAGLTGWVGAAAGLAGLATPPEVRAAPGGLPSQIDHAGSSPEWEKLRERLFRNRPITRRQPPGTSKNDSRNPVPKPASSATQPSPP